MIDQREARLPPLFPEGNPTESPAKPPVSESYARHLSTSKLHSVALLKDSHLQERMASAKMWTPLVSFTVRGPLPLSGAAAEDDVAISP